MKVQLFFGLPSVSLWECIRLLVTYGSVSFIIYRPIYLHENLLALFMVSIALACNSMVIMICRRGITLKSV